MNFAKLPELSKKLDEELLKSKTDTAVAGPPLSTGRLKLDTIQPMTADQAATLKRLAEAAYEREAFKPNLTRAEADVRIATLATKLKLLGEPPHTLGNVLVMSSLPAALVVEEYNDACFTSCGTTTGSSSLIIYFEDKPGRRSADKVTLVGSLPSFVFLTLPYYLRVRLQWLRHSPSRRVLGAFLNAVESRHALSRDAVDWRGDDGQ